MANRDTTITLLLKGNAAALNAALQQGSRQLRGFAAEAEQVGTRSRQPFDQVRASVASISAQLSQAKSQLIAFVGLQGVGDVIGRLVRAADSYANLSAKIKLATTSQASFNQAEAAVFAIAQRTSTSLDATATLFGRLSSALREQGTSQREVLGLTETINKALAVSGATGAEAASTILQLSQAFASGTLRGDEFNSVNDAAPRLMKALADSMGVTVGQLRKLAEEGKLTSEQLRKAFSGDQARKIAAEFGQLPLTIERSLTQLDNAFTRFIGQQDRASGVSTTVAQAIQGLSQNFGALADVLGAVVVAALGRFIANLATAGAAKIQSLRQTRQLALEELAQARAAESAAQAELARARALGLAGTGTARAATAEATLAAAQARTAAATQAATAAVGAKAVAVRGLSTVLTLMGGPLGLAITGVTLLASAFASASANAKAAKLEFESTIQAAQRFREQQDIDAGVDVGKRLIAQREQLRKELESLQILKDGVGPFYGGIHENGGQSSMRWLWGDDVDAEIQRVQAQLKRTNSEFDTVRKSLTDLRAAQATGGRTRQQATKDAADFAKTLADQNERLKVERIEREKGLRAALEYRAVKAAGVKDATQLAEATRKLIDEQVREREAAKASTAADRAQTQARREAEQARKAADRLAKQQKAQQDREDKKEKQTDEELNRTIAEAEIGLLRNRGDSAAARQRELLLEHRDSLAELLQRGRTSDWLKLNLSIETEVARAQLDDLQAQVDRVFGDESRQEQSIQTRQQAGLLTEIGARRELLELHGRTAAEVDQLLPKMDALAAKTGSPDAIERVKDLTAQVAALKTQSNELVVTLTNGFESGLGSALEGLATGTMTLRQALTGLVQDMARSLAQLASQQLAAFATAKIMSVIGKFAGGGKTPDIAQPDPVQAAAAGAAYATPITGASVALGVAGGVVLKAAAAMQVAASTMVAANATKAASGFFAAGGFTGIGPKYAPAGVVHRGEFVHRREVVRQPGARSFLERFNRVGMAALDGLRGYASGGFVTPAPQLPPPIRRPLAERSASDAAGSRASQITNVLYLDPREIVNVMGTQAGRQVILSTIRANAPTVRQDLG